MPRVRTRAITRDGCHSRDTLCGSGNRSVTIKSRQNYGAHPPSRTEDNVTSNATRQEIILAPSRYLAVLSHLFLRSLANFDFRRKFFFLSKIIKSSRFICVQFYLLCFLAIPAIFYFHMYCLDRVKILCIEKLKSQVVRVFLSGAFFLLLASQRSTNRYCPLAAKSCTLVDQFPGEYTPLKSFYNAIARGVYSAGPISRLRKAAASPRASIINEMTSVPTVKSINIKSHVKLRQLRCNRGG